MGIICGKEENQVAPQSKIAPSLQRLIARAPKKGETCQFVLLNKEANSLLTRRMTEKNAQFSEKQSIVLMNELIDLGINYAKKTTDKDQLLVIGNTGSGKSTIVNYLIGCEMEFLSKDQHKIPNQLAPIVRVKADSKIKEKMIIGHSQSVSMTILSDAYYSEDLDLHIVDAAGYYDTRGFEINISNNVNMKALINNSRSITTMLLISWYSILADRSTGLNKMLEMSYQIFGSREQLLKRKDSIIINVTRVPSDISYQEIKNKFLEDDSDEIRLLGDRLIIIDTFENSSIQGSSNRKETYDKLSDQDKVRNPKDFFHIGQSENDEKQLLLQSDSVLQRIKDFLNDAEITKKNQTILKSYEKASQELYSLYTLRKIDHPKTLEICNKAEQSVVDNINDQKKAILEVHLVENFDFKKAEEKAALMSKAIQYFNKSVIEKIDIESFNKQISDSKGRYDKLLDTQKTQFLKDIKQDPKAIAQLLNEGNKQEILDLFADQKSAGQTNIEERTMGNLTGNVGGNVKLGNENTNVNTGKTEAGTGGTNIQNTNIQNRAIGDITGNVGGNVQIGDTNYNINLNNNFLDEDILKDLSGKDSQTDSETKFDHLTLEEQEKVKAKLSKIMSEQKERYLRDMPGLLQNVMDKDEYKNPDIDNKEEIEKVIAITQKEMENNMRKEFIEQAKNAIGNVHNPEAETDSMIPNIMSKEKFGSKVTKKLNENIALFLANKQNKGDIAPDIMELAEDANLENILGPVEEDLDNKDATIIGIKKKKEKPVLSKAKLIGKLNKKKSMENAYHKEKKLEFEKISEKLSEEEKEAERKKEIRKKEIETLRENKRQEEITRKEVRQEELAILREKKRIEEIVAFEKLEEARLQESKMEEQTLKKQMQALAPEINQTMEPEQQIQENPIEHKNAFTLGRKQSLESDRTVDLLSDDRQQEVQDGYDEDM